MNKFPQCNDERACFARVGTGCRILTSTYFNGECPFCKRKQDNVVVRHIEKKWVKK